MGRKKMGGKLMSLISTQDAARILNVSSETVRNLERRGLLSAIKTPRGIRIFDRSDVEKLAVKRARDHEHPEA